MEDLAFYEIGMYGTWMLLTAFSIICILIRIGKSFWFYINTGEFGDFHDSCSAYNILDGEGSKIISALILGVHPIAILADIAVYCLIVFLVGIIWLPLSIILPFMGLAYLIRRRIARKQEFIARLDGTHEEGNGMSGENQAAPTTGSP